MTTSGFTLLDGGMGRELHRIGAPFQQPEWSALALMEAPHFVQQAHESFLRAGAEVITANSYAVVPFHIGAARFAERGAALAALAGQLGRAAIAVAGRPGARLAGSLPPSCGSYRPDLFDLEAAREVLAVLVAGLSPSVDLWLAETQGSIAEARLAREVIGIADKRPFWLSFTLADAEARRIASGEIAPCLRSGESVAEAARAALALGADAMLFNCSDATIMTMALRHARAVFATSDKPPALGVYANAFAPHDHAVPEGANEVISALQKDLSPARYLDFARGWKAEGAAIIGGCCGIGPEYIACLADAFGADQAG